MVRGARWGGGGFARVYGGEPVRLDNGDDGQRRTVTVADYLGAAPEEPLARTIAFSFDDYRILHAVAADNIPAAPPSSEGPSSGNSTTTPLASLHKQPIFSLGRGRTEGEKKQEMRHRGAGSRALVDRRLQVTPSDTPWSEGRSAWHAL